MKPLRHPIETLTRAKRAILFAVSLVVGFVLWYALQQLNVPLKTPQAGWGLLSLELSGTVESSQEIVNSWNLIARNNARSSLLLDLIFPLCYSTVTTIACFWAASLFRERGFRKTAWLATIVAWLQWPAAACDYVENIALWMQLRGPIQDPWPAIGRNSAMITFALIAAALGVIIGAAAILVLRRRAQSVAATPAPSAGPAVRPPAPSPPPQVDTSIHPAR